MSNLHKSEVQVEVKSEVKSEKERREDAVKKLEVEADRVRKSAHHAIDTGRMYNDDEGGVMEEAEAEKKASGLAERAADRAAVAEKLAESSKGFQKASAKELAGIKTSGAITAPEKPAKAEAPWNTAATPRDRNLRDLPNTGLYAWAPRHSPSGTDYTNPRLLVAKQKLSSPELGKPKTGNDEI